MELLTNTVDWGRPVNWSHPLNRGLVSWWLAVPGRAGFGSNIWRDLCGRNHGVLTNMDPATDWVGRRDIGEHAALELDGTNDTVVIPNHASINPGTGDMSWLVNVTNRAAANNNDDLLSDRVLGALGTASGMILGKSGDASSGRLYAVLESTDGSGKNYRYVNAFLVGQRSQILVTWSNASNRLRLFMDGALLAPTAEADDNLTGKTITSASNLTVAGRPGTTDRCWPCRMSEVRVWNREIPPAEAAEYYRLSRMNHPGLLNRIWTPRYAAQEAAAGGNRRRRFYIGAAS